MSPSFEQYDVFDVGGVGEHVNGLDFCNFIVGVHQAEVAGLGGWIAADIDYTLRFCIQYGLHDIGMHAGTRRVGNDDVGSVMLCYEVVGQDVLHISGKELCVTDAVNLRVYLRIFYGLWNILNTDNLRCTFGNKVGYSASTGIEVVDEGEGRCKM